MSDIPDDVLRALSNLSGAANHLERARSLLAESFHGSPELLQRIEQLEADTREIDEAVRKGIVEPIRRGR